jgi:LPS O-antigen subunit length determinant protein (WzzB/FepE family)
MSQQFPQKIIAAEISQSDIIYFLLESWKVILATGFVGFIVGLCFVVITPSQYEATAQIQMAQNSMGANVESPSLLVARYQIPSAYMLEQVKACGLEGEKLPQESLARLTKLKPVKGVDSVVELKVRLESREQAISCARALSENIKVSQSLIVQAYIEEAKSLLVKYSGRLKEIQAFLTNTDKSSSALAAAYLANLDEIRFLTNESNRLKVVVITGDARQAKLVSPIYASDIPASPNKGAILALGLLTGLFVGLLLMLLRKVWNNYRSNNY